MSTATLTQRQQIVDSLSDDLTALGWNQKNKFWWVRGETGDEWFEYGGEFTGAPEKHLLQLIQNDQGRPEGSTGVVIATEGWAYPQTLTDSLTSEAALRAYWRLMPPSEHPDKVELRQLLLVSADGEVLGLTTKNDSGKEWARIGPETVSPVGDAVVDSARALFGLHDTLKDRVSRRNQPKRGGDPFPMPDLEGMPDEIKESFLRVKAILETVADVMDGSLSPTEASLKVFLALDEPSRREMLAGMPPTLVEQLAQAMPEELRKQYGL